MRPEPSDRTHPRPQLTRPWYDLSGAWQFAYDDDDRGRDEGWHRRAEPYDRTIAVPFPPESSRSGVGDPGYHPVLWYRRTFGWQPDPGQRTILHLGAVDYRASVWVNGQHVTDHEGGHTRFSVDITAELGPGGEHVVVVRAEDQPGDLEQPRGKQDWEAEPHNIWYRRTSGIWQPVWLEQVGSSRVASLHWTPDLATGRLALEARVAGRPTDGPLRLRVRLSLRGDLLADDTYSVVGGQVRRDLVLSDAWLSLNRGSLLWSPEHPSLIDASLELLDGAGTVVDRVGSYTAMRSASAGNGRFELNGRPYFLRLVLAQGFWPDSHLAADEAALRAEVELAKSFGFTGVRLHQHLADPRLLAWCDRLGLLVWAEMPAAYEFSPRATDRLTREWLEVLERDRSHPCVIAWVPFNESWGVPALATAPAQQQLVRSLHALTKAVDPTRPVVGNDGWEQVVTDILTVHDYSASGEVLRDRYGTPEAVDRTLLGVQPQYHSVLLPGTPRGPEPVMITEFGGITLAGPEDEVWLGYGGVTDAATFVERYQALVDALLDSPMVTGFCYTQLTDTGQERNGLVTEARLPKVSAEVIRRINGRPSAAVPADAVGAFQYGDYPISLHAAVESEDENEDQANHGHGHDRDREADPSP